MLFFSLCTDFYDLGYGLIGEYDGNNVCKIANSMPKISTHVWFSLKQGAVMMKTWINFIVMVLCVCLCFCCPECLTMIFQCCTLMAN